MLDQSSMQVKKEITTIIGMFDQSSKHHERQSTPMTTTPESHCAALADRMALAFTTGDDDAFCILAALACPECWRLFGLRLAFAESVQADIAEMDPSS